nr:type VI-A CRISPR-associated RNA-guided ribonuclease Cas13a [uncultured Cohaesibacter sp.]
MKIVHTLGSSFTHRAGAKSQPSIARSLRPLAKFDASGDIGPDEIGTYLEENLDFVIRKYASFLDRTIRKIPLARKEGECFRALTDLPLEIYIKRDLLGDAIWTEIEKRFRGKIDKTSLREAQKRWLLAKVHPYAIDVPARNARANRVENRPEHRVRALKNDKNGKKMASSGYEPDAFKGALLDHPSLFKGVALPDFGESWDARIYQQLAEKLSEHIFGKKSDISEEDVGHLKAIGGAIGQSTNDPSTRSPSLDGIDVAALDPKSRKQFRLEQLRAHLASTGKSDFSVIDGYFGENDVIAAIHNGILCPDRLQAGFVPPSYFGRMLSEHLKKNIRLDETDKILVFTLHNQIRSFYAKIAKSQRFKKAIRGASSDPSEANPEFQKLKHMLPKDHKAFVTYLREDEAPKGVSTAHLGGVLNAQIRNREISRYIRMGKIIAHAADLPIDQQNPQQKFEENIEFYLTSDGQSEIKRNESFVRSWRTAIGLSRATVSNWAFSDATDRDGGDITNKNQSIKAFKKSHLQHFNSYCQILFGTKGFDLPDFILPDFDSSKKVSRADIFACDGEETAKETIWLFIRLAAELRNKTLHFNIRDRLIKRLTRSVLNPTESPPNIDQRPNEVVEQEAYGKLGKLLEFDIKLQKAVLLDEINQTGLGDYLTKKQVDDILKQLSQKDADQMSDTWGVAFPRFKSVLNRISGIAQSGDLPNNLKRVTELDLKAATATTPLAAEDEEGKQKRKIEKCKLDLMYLLYSSGFRTWLLEKNSNKGFIQRMVKAVIDAKISRKASYDEEHGRLFSESKTYLSQLGLGQQDDLKSVLSILTAQSLRQDDLDKKYSIHPKENSRRSGWIEEFKQELFGFFLGTYLETEQLDWIWTIQREPLEAPLGRPVEMSDLSGISLSKPNHQEWHAPIYAWLYTLPLEEASRLRQQLLKSSVLDKKSNDPTKQKLQQKLKEFDWLIALYLKVQGAGFSGTEHRADDTIGRMVFGEHYESFYTSAQSDDGDNGPENGETEALLTAPGTARGLRQMMRSGHLKLLEGIFTKHQITYEEMNRFLLSSEGATSKFTEKAALVEKIRELCDAHKNKGRKEREKDQTNFENEVKKCADDYKRLAGSTAIHNFTMKAVRMDDHARVYQIMMRIVGRLADFTLMWERDWGYAFLGMIYHSLNEKLQIELRTIPSENSSNKQRASWGLKVPERCFESDGTHSAQDDPLHCFIPIWREIDDFEIGGAAVNNFRLSNENRALYSHFFYKAKTGNPKDKDRSPQYRSKHRLGRFKIRHDFAHGNILRYGYKLEKEQKAQTRYPRLNYRINAVRGLMSYDRKMKNAVSRAIKDVLAREGFDISWTMKGDRLSNAEVTPRLETHLTMLPYEQRKELQVFVPRHSIRLTSMVKALFEHDTGGYREFDGPVNDRKRRGELHYPSALLEDVGAFMPNSLEQSSHPALKK